MKVNCHQYRLKPPSCNKPSSNSPRENSSINVRGLSAGIYLVVVEQGGKAAGTERLVIW